jgi:hypothetical protein
MAKHKDHKKTTIQHHGDGSHTMTRHHVKSDGTSSSHSSAHQSLDHLHDAIQDHMGTPNPGEAAADMGDHGIPMEHAGPAGLPAPAAPASTPATSQMQGAGV